MKLIRVKNLHCYYYQIDYKPDNKSNIKQRHEYNHFIKTIIIALIKIFIKPFIDNDDRYITEKRK